MWLIVENSPENIALLNRLEFRFPDGTITHTLKEYQELEVLKALGITL